MAKQRLTFWQTLRLAWQLLNDPATPAWLRWGIPLAGVLYVLLPWDAVFDALPFLGQVDDAVVLLALAWLLVRLAPAGLRERLRKEPRPEDDEGRVLEGEGKVLDE